MSEISLKIREDANRLTGSLKGLSDGLSFWKPDEVTQEAIDRLQASLDDLRVKSGDVADYLSSKVQEGGE